MFDDFIKRNRGHRPENRDTAPAVPNAQIVRTHSFMNSLRNGLSKTPNPPPIEVPGLRRPSRSLSFVHYLLMMAVVMALVMPAISRLEGCTTAYEDRVRGR